MKKKYITIVTIICILLSLVFFGCLTLDKRLGGGWPYPKPYTVPSIYSKNQRVYLQVYCEDTFDFQKKGICTGSFKLSSMTDFDALSLQIIIPKFYALSPEYESRWNSHLSLPAKIVFEWIGKDGSNHNAITTAYNDGSSYSGYIGFEYVPLPRNKTIQYTLTYDAGSYCEAHGCKGLEERIDKTMIDRTADIRNHPNNYPDFWTAKFMVVEGMRKGPVHEHKKPAKD